MSWINVKDRKPHCYMTGDWDGKVSDKVLLVDSRQNILIGSLNEGFIDGSSFSEWYDQDDFEVKNEILFWQPLPSLP